MAHGFYSKTLIRPPVSTSGQGIYLVPAYEIFKGSIYDRKKLKWNVGTEHIPVMIEATLKKTPRNEKAIQTWLEGANWKNVTGLVVDIDHKDIKEVSLGDVVKDQVKPGAKFNRGNVSEGILAAAIAARFVNKLGTVTPEHVNNILKKMTKKGKKLDSTFKGPNQNLKIVEDWVNKSDLFKFMCEDKNARSSTSITLLIKDEWFNKFNEEEQRALLKKLFTILEKESVANDINGYPKAPPSIRIWGGSTVQNKDIKVLLPWIDWAYNSIKNNA